MLKAGDRIGEYELIQVLGEGGMGSVWLAQKAGGGEMRALKIPHERFMRDPGFRERFYKEAEAQLNLRHANIVPAYELIEDGQIIALVLHYVPGSNLERRIYGEQVDHSRRGTPLPMEEAFHVSIQILDALDHAHQHDWVHRDVKPSNILIEEGTGVALLTDFGVVRKLASRRRTLTGTVVGTVWYMSPEEILRPKTADHRSDVYSFGIVLFEMLAGRPPFDVEEDEEGDPDYIIRNKHVGKEPPRLRQFVPDMPEPIEQLVMIALEKEPDKRYSGCGDFLATLQDAVRQGLHLPAAKGTGNGHHVQKPQPPHEEAQEIVVPPAKPEPGRFRLLWVAITILALVLAGVAVYKLAENGELGQLQRLTPWYDPVQEEWSALNKDSSEDLQFFIRKHPTSSIASDAKNRLRELEARDSENASNQQWKIWNDWPKDRAADVQDYLRLHPAAVPVPQAQKRLDELQARDQAALRDLAGTSPLKVPGAVQP